MYRGAMWRTVNHGERGATDEVVRRLRTAKSCSSSGTLPGNDRRMGIGGCGRYCGDSAVTEARRR